MSENSFISKSREETLRLGEDFAKSLQGGSVVCFFGELGSGKTTFIQGLAKGLGIKRRIISPTFIIIRHYQINFNQATNFYHIDLYRTQTKDDLLGLGVDEIIENNENIVAIEWAEKMNNLLPQKRVEIHCEYINDSERKITFNHYE